MRDDSISHVRWRWNSPLVEVQEQVLRSRPAIEGRQVRSEDLRREYGEQNHPPRVRHLMDSCRCADQTP